MKDSWSWVQQKGPAHFQQNVPNGYGPFHTFKISPIPLISLYDWKTSKMNAKITYHIWYVSTGSHNECVSSVRALLFKG